MITFLAILIYALQLSGQYDYFSVIEGSYGDTVLESTASVEVLPDGYVSLGLYSTIGYNHVYLYKYDFQGNRIDSNAIAHPNEYVFIGRNNNLIYRNGQLVFSSLLEQADLSRVGYLMEFDAELDTIFTKRYSPFTVTDITGLSSLEEGYLQIGKYRNSTQSFTSGTYLAKVNYDGDYEWLEVLQPHVDDKTFLNLSVEEFDEGIIVAGSKSEGDLIGYLTITDTEGEVITEIEYADDDYDEWSPLGLAKLSNSEVMVVQSLGYEEFPNNLNFDYYWKNVRLAKIDPLTGEETWSQVYHEDYTISSGDWIDIEPTPDGGVVILGWAYEPDNLYFNWIMKVDANGNEEWFKTYTAEDCTACFNLLQDIEVAPDGGYVAAGRFEYWEIDGFRNAWLLKIDACGDTEWQGCDPLSTSQIDKTKFNIYPNPTAGDFTINSLEGERISEYKVRDLSGRTLIDQKPGSPRKTLSDHLEVPSGVYIIEIISESGKVGQEKIQVIGK